MENQEKVIEKIRKVLELSKNNPSAEEAKSAAIKAQKMMAEYHVELADIEGVSDIDKISEDGYYTHSGGKWKFTLASIVSRNFRCKNYSKGNRWIMFYGHEIDTKIATEVFEYLYTLGTKLATKEYNKYKKEYGTASGIMNSWYVGYMDGIKSVLEKQSTALMVIVPPDVEDEYENFSANFRTRRRTISINYNDKNSEARQSGFEAGKNAMQSRAIEGGK